MRSRRRMRRSSAACRSCKIPGHWRSKDAWCGCSALRACAGARRVSSGAISEPAKWRASRSAAAMSIVVGSAIRTSRAWCCSMAAAAQAGVQRRSCGRSSSRRAQPESVSGAEGTRMTTRPFPSLAPLNPHAGETRLSRFRNLDRADVREDVLGEVVGHVVGQRRQRLVLVGALDCKAKAPGVQRRAAFGANDGVQLCLLRGGLAERGDVAGERRLHLPAAFAAEERDRHVGDLKASLVRLVLRCQTSSYPFCTLSLRLPVFGLRSKTAGRSSLTNSPSCVWLACACAADAAQLARIMSAARWVPLLVILSLRFDERGATDSADSK